MEGFHLKTHQVGTDSAESVNPWRSTDRATEADAAADESTTSALPSRRPEHEPDRQTMALNDIIIVDSGSPALVSPPVASSKGPARRVWVVACPKPPSHKGTRNDV